ncbi:hypothetical protein [Deinococcus ficus]|uniref:Uncharacterized protein n=1 Tax=Deinococcus ficus TaxID=317577 RepID=A0A221T3N0_9DEIO|nr:hypothetical protein [Deinococcus ficus]ASN83451.1 hypothetical protein DFI_19835 [Deinococcus ficus]
MITVIGHLTGTDARTLAQGLRDIATYVSSGGADAPSGSGYAITEMQVQAGPLSDEAIGAYEAAFRSGRASTQLLLVLESETGDDVNEALDLLAEDLDTGEYDMTGRQGPGWQARFCELNL